MSLYAQVYALDVNVGENFLELSYPQGNSTSGFSFLVGANSWDAKRDVHSWADVEGLKVNITGTVDAEYSVTFNGPVGGAGGPIK